MKFIFTVMAILLTAITATLAQTCQEKFVDLITNVCSNKGPSKIFITQDGKCVFKSKNYFYTNGKDHSLTEMIEPKDAPWTLIYNNAGYSSSDKGKTWKKSFEFNAEQQRKSTEETLKKDAISAREIVCGEKKLDGVDHETIAGEYDSSMISAKIQDKFWVNTKTGWISKKVSTVKNKNTDSISVQIIEPATDLKLPLPQ